MSVEYVDSLKDGSYTPGDISDPDNPDYIDTNWGILGDPSGDQALDDAEKVPVGWMILILIVVGVIIVAAVFYMVYRCEREDNNKAKQRGGGGGEHNSTSGDTKTEDGGDTVPGSPMSAASSATPRGADEPLSAEQIEAGLITQTWVAEVLPITTEETAPTNHTSNPSENEEEEETKQDEEMAMTPPPPTTTTNKSSQQPACPICNKKFQSGDMVCSSYNPNCGHTFHKQCMYNWLEYQNRCPVCNEAYLSYHPSQQQTTHPRSSSPPNHSQEMNVWEHKWQRRKEEIRCSVFAYFFGFASS